MANFPFGLARTTSRLLLRGYAKRLHHLGKRALAHRTCPLSACAGVWLACRGAPRRASARSRLGAVRAFFDQVSQLSRTCMAMTVRNQSANPLALQTSSADPGSSPAVCPATISRQSFRLLQPGSWDDAQFPVPAAPSVAPRRCRDLPDCSRSRQDWLCTSAVSPCLALPVSGLGVPSE